MIETILGTSWGISLIIAMSVCIVFVAHHTKYATTLNEVYVEGYKKNLNPTKWQLLANFWWVLYSFIITFTFIEGMKIFWTVVLIGIIGVLVNLMINHVEYQRKKAEKERMRK